MEYTDITWDCYGVTVSPTVEEFRIETTVTSAGELPTTAIFVYTIQDPEDSGVDSFVRVGNPQDIQNLKIDRNAAVAAGDTEYRSNFAGLQYPDLDVAIQAKALFASRIDDLVKRWIKYEDDFVVDSGTSILFPRAASSVETALIAAYTTAKEAREAAEIVAADAATAKDDAEVAIEHASEMEAAYRECVDYLAEFMPQLNTYHLSIVTEGTTASSLWGGVSGSLQTRAATCGTNLQYWANTRSTRQYEFSERTTEKIAADAAVVAAEAAEDEALAAVLAVCPDFDPATV